MRTLLGHLIGVAHRDLGTARDAPSPAPHVVTDVDDKLLAPELETLFVQAISAWATRRAPDLVHAPWGQVTALVALRGFTIEAVTHGWDLAVDTGQPALLDEVAQRCLDAADDDVVPVRLRGTMYDEALVVGDESATERLVHLLGRRRR